ncbi:MAG: hypothetical protein NTZ20_03245 [Candidatus Levybacteria bacterium]|nr:hypothetical protein [Candidatus Levybacteria bacterium]
MSREKLIIYISGASIVLVLVFYFFGGSGMSVSSNILYITQPVTNLSATVDKVSGDTITISQQLSIGQVFSPSILPDPKSKILPTQGPLPTPVMKKITYQVRVTSATKIVSPPSYVPYLLRQNNPSMGIGDSVSNMTIKDISVGQQLQITFSKDLRTVSGNKVDASFIQLPNVQNNLSGRIVSVSGNSITLKAFAPIAQPAAGVLGSTPQTPIEKIYTFNVTSSTEISRQKISSNPANPSQAESVAISDIKAGVQVVIFTNSNILTGTTLQALLISLPPVISSASVTKASTTQDEEGLSPVVAKDVNEDMNSATTKSVEILPISTPAVKKATTTVTP